MEIQYQKVGKKQKDEVDAHEVKTRLSHLIAKNKEAAFQSKWRKEAFPERQYERLQKSNVVCDGLSNFEQKIVEYELETSLPNCFVGIPYSYNDVGQSEDWMKSMGGFVQQKNTNLPQIIKGKTMKSKEKIAADALAQDDGVVKAQVRTTMEMLLISVQDRVMTQNGVLDHPELISANWLDVIDKSQHGNEINGELSEQPVWGIDCYTRQNVMNCLEICEDYKKHAETFIEKWLLPALNACPTDLAHDITIAARILEGESSVKDSPLYYGNTNSTSNMYESSGKNNMAMLAEIFAGKVSRGPHWLHGAAHQLRLASNALGESAFRVHPKGHGAVVLKKEGIAANTLVTQYRGEIYPPWRWGEKMDAIEEVQEKFGLRPVLPDFYNMVLERPRIDPRGYGLLFVDASRKSGLGSLLSHSCSPTCHVHVAAVSGSLSLVMTTARDVEQGEELTFDYNAVTESLNEYMSAVCLCGHINCRSSFLHFATADCYQQILARNAPIAVRLCSLIRSANKQVMSQDDEKVLQRHGFHEAVFGAVSYLPTKGHTLKKSLNPNYSNSIEFVPVWLRTYVADVLRYIEYERRALPIALLCNHFKNKTKPKEIATLPSNKLESIESKGNLKTGVKFSKKQKKKGNNNTDDSHLNGIQSNSTAVSCKKKKGEIKFLTSAKTSISKKRIPGSRPQNSFLYYSKINRKLFAEIFTKQSDKSVKGAAMLKGIQNVASDAWKKLSDEEKLWWKKQAIKDWEKNGGKEKARQEKERTKKSEIHGSENNFLENGKKTKKDQQRKETYDRNNESSETIDEYDLLKDDNAQISFQDADAEGRILLEQRIQALTQSLSRVGRILGCDREKKMDNSEFEVISCDNSHLHAPVTLMPDKKVVKLIWGNKNGIVRALIRFAKTSDSITPFIKNSIKKIVSSYQNLDKFCLKSCENAQKITDVEAKQLLSQALLDLRRTMLSGIKMADQDVAEFDKKKKVRDLLQLSRKRKLSAKKGAATRKLKKLAFQKSVQKTNAEPDNFGVEKSNNVIQNIDGNSNETQNKIYESSSTSTEYNEMINEKVYEDSSIGTSSLQSSEKCMSTTSDSLIKVEEQDNNHGKRSQRSDDVQFIDSCTNKMSNEELEGEAQYAREVHYMKKYRNNKYKLEAIADILLFYAHTNTFFKIQKYGEVSSTPIKVYARELGNEVPYDIIDSNGPAKKFNESGDNVQKMHDACQSTLHSKSTEDDILTKERMKILSNQKKKTSSKRFCNPADTITSVARKYSPSYVFYQLLQWANAGIGSRSDIPDMLGCVLLPHITSCFSDKKAIIAVDSENDEKEKIYQPNDYSTELRPMLAEWLVDRLARGNPWPKPLKEFFSSSKFDEKCANIDSSNKMLGSPVLDLLVTGDDSNICHIIHALKKNFDATSKDFGDSKNKVAFGKLDSLESTVDEGMPVQAKVNWAQCENVNCMKWRKLPFHVDIDALPKKFYCRHNIWNPNSNSCSAPEDVWDEEKDAIVS